MRNLFIILALTIHFGSAAEASLSLDDLKKLPANFDKALLYSMQCIELVTNEFAEITNLEFGLATTIRKLKKADYELWFQEVKFDVTSIEGFESQIMDFVKTQNDYILSDQIKPLQDQVSIYLRDLVSHTIMTNQRANLGFLYKAFSVVAHDIPEYIRTSVTAEHLPRLIDENTSEEDQKTILNRINRLYHEYQIRYLLNCVYMRQLLASDKYSDFVNKPYDESSKATHQDLEEVRYHTLFEDRDFGEKYMPHIFLKMLATKNRDKNYFFTEVFIKSSLMEVVKIMTIPIRRSVSKAVLKSSTLDYHRSIKEHKYYKQFADFIGELKNRESFSFEQAYETNLFRFDYLATHEDYLQWAELDMKEWEYLIKVNSNINNIQFFLNYFKYFRVSADNDATEPRFALIPLYLSLYTAFLQERNTNANLLTESDWVQFFDKLYYRRYTDTYHQEFIGASVILTKMCFGNKLTYYYRQYAEGTQLWLSILSNTDEFVIDYQRMNDKYVPNLRKSLTKHMVIPTSGHLTRAELATLKKKETMEALNSKLESGHKMVKMTDLDSTFESGEDVFVYIIEKGVSKEEFLKHISE